jgi:hypothetical protein
VRRTSAAIILVLLTSLASPLPAQAAWDWNKCGSQKDMGAGWYNVRSHRVGCHDARAVARRFWNKGAPDHVTVDGRRYACDYEQVGYETLKAHCEADANRIVKFHFGS